MAKRKVNKIAANEALPTSPPPEEVIADLEADAGAGGDVTVGDTMWPDPDGLIYGDMGPRNALDEILMAIIESNRDATVQRSGEDLKAKSLLEYRLEQAKHFLTGYNAKRGRRSENDALMMRVAKRYYLSALDFSDEDSALRQIMASETGPHDGRDNDQIDDKIGHLIKEFKKRKDELLIRASSVGLPELEDRKRKVQQVIGLLRQLDIITPSENRA